MLLGGDGVISVTANVAPRLMHDMSLEAIAGKRESAEALDAQLLGLHKNLFVEANPIPAKWAVARMGLIDKGIRLPMTWMSAAYEAQMETAMRDAGVL